MDFGLKVVTKKNPKPHPIHINTDATVLRAYQWHQYKLLRRWTSARINAHICGSNTLYFVADERVKTPSVLVNIDIDCHESGTLEGATAFAEWLKTYHFPNLYYEVSTNGNGIHAYIIIDKHETGSAALKFLLYRLQHRLRSLLSVTTFDVQDVEVKGLPPVFTWKHGVCTGFTSGTLAKLPRCIDRFDELQNTTRISPADLLKLQHAPASGLGKDSWIVRQDTTTPDVAITPVQPKPAKKKIRTKIGSTSGQYLDDEELDKVSGVYLDVAKELIDRHGEIRCHSGEGIVQPEDVAIFLMLLKLFTTKIPNDNGAMPTRRFAAWWDMLRKRGDINRAWNPNRYKAIRDYLSSLQLFTWEDETYEPGYRDWTGKHHQGEACKWHASPRLLRILEEKREERNTSVKGEISNLLDTIESSSPHHTIRPKERPSLYRLVYRDDQIDIVITPFHLAA